MSSKQKQTSIPSPTSSTPEFLDPIPGIFPFGSVNIFGGASGVGKTKVGAPFSRALADGAPYMGRTTHKPTGVYYLTADRGWSTYQRTFAAANHADILHYALTDDKQEIPKARTNKGQFELFERCIQKLKPTPGAFVFVDPIAPTFVRGDQNNAWDASTAMHHFRWIAQLYQITILGFSNVVKERTETGFVRARDRISGSGALGAYSDTQWYLINGKAPNKRIFGWAPREEAEVEYVMRFNPETRLYEYESGPWDVGEALNESDENGETDTGRERELLACIGTAPQYTSTEDIQQFAAALPKPISRRSCFRYLGLLVDDMTITKRHGAYAKPVSHMRVVTAL